MIKRMWIVGFIFLLFSCVSMSNDIMLSDEHLKTLALEDFSFSDENMLQVTINESLFEINNVVRLDTNPDNITYFFLSTMDVGKQILVVLNTNLQKLQWGDYYTEYCYFDPIELVALVAEPFPERHQEVTMKLYDFGIDLFHSEEKYLYFFLGTSEGDKQAYYQIPEYNKSTRKDGSYSWYTISWKQAQHVFDNYVYSLEADNRGYKITVLRRQVLDELVPLEYSLEKWAFPDGYSAIGRNINGTYETVIISPKDESPGWENYEIYTLNTETGEESIILFKDVFRYQDALLNIIPAQNRDERVAFIVETAEFAYDFYFDPVGDTTDIFLRPSSFAIIPQQ